MHYFVPVLITALTITGYAMDSRAQAPAAEPVLNLSKGSGQAYPTKPIRVLVPFLTGGTPDIQIRMLAEKLTPRMGQQ